MESPGVRRARCWCWGAVTEGVGCGGKGGSGEGVPGKGGLRVVRRRIGTECSRLECGGRDLREIRRAGVRR